MDFTTTEVGIIAATAFMAYVGMPTLLVTYDRVYDYMNSRDKQSKDINLNTK